MAFLQLPAGQIFYREIGEGSPPVLLLHGFGGTHRLWRAVQHELADNHRSFAVDLRGAGRSARPGSYRLDDHLADLSATASDLATGRLVLVGFSMGAVIAAVWAAAHAERVRGLVLVAPAPLDGVPPGREAEAAQAYARIRARRTDPAAQLAELRHSSPRGLADSLLAALVEDERSWDPVALDAALDTVGAARSLDPLAAARVPVLVVAGDRDRLLPLQLADVARLPGAALHVFYRVGHLIPLEVPGGLAALIEDFIEHGPGAPGLVARVTPAGDVESPVARGRRGLSSVRRRGADGR